MAINGNLSLTGHAAPTAAAAISRKPGNSIRGAMRRTSRAPRRTPLRSPKGLQASTRGKLRNEPTNFCGGYMHYDNQSVSLPRSWFSLQIDFIKPASLLLVFLLLASFSSAAPYFDEQRASGVWVFDLFASDVPEFVTAPLDEAAKMICAGHPCVKGFATRISWRDLEPEDGKFDWTYTDRLFEIAEKYDKLVALRVIGWEIWESKDVSPQWMWKKFTQYVDQNTTWQEVTRIPYLGDNVFLADWLRLTRALGERYAGNPRLQRVHMSTGIDQEMYYVRTMTPEQIATLAPAGVDALVNDLLDHWHKTFLGYKEAFPDKAFVLDLSQPIANVEGVDSNEIMYRVVLDAADVFGPRLYLQQDGLSERNPPADEVVKSGSKSNRALMMQLSDKQMLGLETLLPPQQKGKMPVNPPEKLFISDLRKTIDIGLTFPIRYMEFWVATLQDPETLPDIQYAKAELEKRVAGE